MTPTVGGAEADLLWVIAAFSPAALLEEIGEQAREKRAPVIKPLPAERIDFTPEDAGCTRGSDALPVPCRRRFYPEAADGRTLKISVALPPNRLGPGWRRRLG
jgi:hypothetical protein